MGQNEVRNWIFHKYQNGAKTCYSIWAHVDNRWITYKRGKNYVLIENEKRWEETNRQFEIKWNKNIHDGLIQFLFLLSLLSCRNCDSALFLNIFGTKRRKKQKLRGQALAESYAKRFSCSKHRFKLNLRCVLDKATVCTTRFFLKF